MKRLKLERVKMNIGEFEEYLEKQHPFKLYQWGIGDWAYSSHLNSVTFTQAYRVTANDMLGVVREVLAHGLIKRDTKARFGTLLSLPPDEEKALFLQGRLLVEGVTFEEMDWTPMNESKNKIAVMVNTNSTI